MRLVRLGQEPTTVGADIRAAVSVWGQGTGVLGGVALFGCTPPGCRRPLDAVLVVPRGVIVVVGVDLPEPALKLEAPLHTPWTVDGWPLVRSEGGVNPGLDALESASALARSLQSRDVEPLPVATIVAVGPFVERVTQPTSDLHRGLRVIHPSTSSMLAAARELATYERDCPVEPARHLLRTLDAHAELGVTELSAEGFPDSVTPDLASAETMLIAKVADAAPAREPAGGAAATGGGSTRVRKPAMSRRGALIALTIALLVVLGTAGLLALGSGPSNPRDASAATVRIDGVEFARQAERSGTDCAARSFGDVQAWLSEHRCSRMTRSAYAVTVSGKAAIVGVTQLQLADEGAARELQGILTTPGTGGVSPVTVDSGGSPLSPGSAARAVRSRGETVRIALAAWQDRPSAPTNVRLRALTERALRLPA